MNSQNRMPTTRAHAPRFSRAALLGLALLVGAAGMLSGCVIEPGGHYHGWWWHHHDHD